jgi:hypothetical protein
MRTRHRALLALAAWLTWGAGAEEAAAQSAEAGAPVTPEACFSAAESAQPLMKEHKLRAAQARLRTCAREECPKAARGDCRTWLAEVSRSIPTVVFAAREDTAGGISRAVSDVRVSVDGEVLVASRIDASAVSLDPGVHLLRFEHGGFAPVEQRIDVRAGESGREIDVVFRVPDPTQAGASPTGGAGQPSGSEATSGSAELPPSPADTTASAPVPFAAYALGAGAIVALGLGATMEAIGLSDRQHLVDSCQPTRSCAQSDVDSARTRVTIGDVALGLGAALAAGALVVYLTRGPASPGPTSGVHVRFAPVAVGAMASGATLSLEGSL